jgi:signal transduction histidine kinase
MALRLETMMAERRKDEESRSELIAGISHDLRTPLTSIRACLEGIKTGVASTPEQQQKYLSIVQNKAQDLEHIINQLFLFSKLDVGEFPVSEKKLEMKTLLTEIMAELSDEYERRGLSVALDGLTQGVYANIDPVLFRGVIVNILENSAKYKNTKQGRLKIECGAAGDTVEIRLSDDGPGVPEELLPKLFDVFYRAYPSRNTKGSGLGLAISQKIINRMGGAIHAELCSASKLPAGKQGLAIVIHLPVADGAGL